MATKKEVAEVYVATFNRAADADGLGYWDGEGSAHTSLTDIADIAEAMLASPEVAAMYGDPSAEGFDREAFVIKLYNNILNKTVDGSDEGVQYWVKSTDISNAKMIVALINGAKSDTGDPKDKATLANKTEVGIAFADAGLNDVDRAKDVMSAVTDDSNSVSSAKAIIETIAPLGGSGGISISGDGTTTADDSSTEIFKIGVDKSYSHTIINFDTKEDKLNFGKDITSKDIAIHNTDDDGQAELIYATDGGTTEITITLTGLTHDEDMALTTTAGLEQILM